MLNPVNKHSEWGNLQELLAICTPSIIDLIFKAVALWNLHGHYSG